MAVHFGQWQEEEGDDDEKRPHSKAEVMEDNHRFNIEPVLIFVIG